MNIGIVGGGQLGQMLAYAGLKLGHSFKFLVPKGECCVEALGEVIRGDFTDTKLLREFASGVDVFTYEWENVPQATLDALSGFAPMRPSPKCAKVAKDRIQEKKFFQAAGLNVQKFAAVSCESDLAAALEHVGTPAMLKTRGQGYDGKGQRRITDPARALEAFEQLANVPCILESFVAFDFEISLIAVRGYQLGATALGATTKSAIPNAPSAATIYFYPPCLNQHVNGILHKTSVPAEGVLPELLEHTQAAVAKMMETLDYEGILCVEFFVSNTPAGQQLIANEMAPRVHNSGHWSIEGAVTSQFTNHILAITRQPLGSTATHAKAVMINLVGTIPLSLEAPQNINAHLLVKEAIGGATVARTVVVDTPEQNQNVTAHIYGKSPRPGRKLGHITAVGENAPRLAESVLNG